MPPLPQAEIERMLSNIFVPSWDQHIGRDGAVAIMNMLHKAGFKIVEQNNLDARIRELETQVRTMEMNLLHSNAGNPS